jgi:hypothetical protein
MKKIVQISFMFFLFLRFAAQAQSETQDPVNVRDNVVAEAKKGGYQLISPEELKKEYLKDSTAILLIDVRQEWSYQMQHINGSLHIDFAPTWWNQYSPMMRSEMRKTLGPYKDKKLVFY